MQTLEQLQGSFAEYAAGQSFLQEPASLYAPMNYLLSLGGKALRPVLLLAGCQVFTDDISQAYAPSFGIELFHNFSLMHDDIMDAAPTRRGKATVHALYDANTAILSGDAMLVYAYDYISRVQANILPEVLSVFNRTALGVCEGQRYDMDFERQERVSVEEYLRMIELKTAVLLQGALHIGARIGGAEPEQARILGEFGRHLGIAFQLQDDWLDTFGDEASFGKRIGGDIVQNKKTYLYLKALERADEQNRARLQDFLKHPTDTAQAQAEKIASVTELFVELGADQSTAQAVQDYHDRALACLPALGLPEERLQPLLDMAAKLALRRV